MTIETAEQLVFAREKLAMLETRCRELRASEPLSYTQSLSLDSLCNLAKQLKEQISRYECGHGNNSHASPTIRGIQSAEQWKNTQAKLEMLETQCREIRAARKLTHVDELTLRSLKKLANQLTEEMARYRAHHPAVSSGS